MKPDELKALDRWITAKGKGLSRPEAIRQLVRTAVADS
jgi:hypothetical protein